MVVDSGYSAFIFAQFDDGFRFRWYDTYVVIWGDLGDEGYDMRVDMLLTNLGFAFAGYYCGARAWVAGNAGKIMASSFSLNYQAEEPLN